MKLRRRTPVILRPHRRVVGSIATTVVIPRRSIHVIEPSQSQQQEQDLELDETYMMRERRRRRWRRRRRRRRRACSKDRSDRHDRLPGGGSGDGHSFSPSTLAGDAIPCVEVFVELLRKLEAPGSLTPLVPLMISLSALYHPCSRGAAARRRRWWQW